MDKEAMREISAGLAASRAKTLKKAGFFKRFAQDA